jgi:RimJ/RimL family protein N-acetyltransferase
MLETPRLLLRPWRHSDFAPFAELNADPAVMRLLGGALTREASDAYVGRAEAHFAEHGFCKWAVEAPGVAPLVGAVGLSYVRFEASFTPAVEVAWTAAIGAADTRLRRPGRPSTMGSAASA